MAATHDLRARNLLRFAKHGKALRIALTVKTRFRCFEFPKPTGELALLSVRLLLTTLLVRVTPYWGDYVPSPVSRSLIPHDLDWYVLHAAFARLPLCASPGPAASSGFTPSASHRRRSADGNFVAMLGNKFGWGGRIRTFTVLINSEVSYQLDHAPAGDRGRSTETARCGVGFAKKRVRSIPLTYHEADAGPTAWLLNYLKNLNRPPCDEHLKRGLIAFAYSKMKETRERRDQKI